MSDMAVTERRLTVGEIAARLGVSYSTASRLLDDDDLLVIRDRSWRMAYESQIAYIVAALNACRPGSIRDFATEWRVQHEQAALSAPQAVAS